MCSAFPVPLCGLATLCLHLHDIDINMIDKLHSLTNHGLGLGIKSLANKSLASTIKSLITTLVGSGLKYE